jgi:hypothetical protein
MNRRETIVTAVFASLLAVAALGLWMLNRAHVAARSTPAWLNAGGDQGPENVGQVPLTAAQSLAANGVPNMTACCRGRGAPSRIRKTYPASLAAEPSSIISAHVGFQLGGGCD